MHILNLVFVLHKYKQATILMIKSRGTGRQTEFQDDSDCQHDLPEFWSTTTASPHPRPISHSILLICPILLSTNFGKINNNNDWFFSLAQFRHSTLVNLGHILGRNFIRSTKPTFGGIGTENLKGCQAKISPDCGKARIKGIKAKPGLLRQPVPKWEHK